MTSKTTYTQPAGNCLTLQEVKDYLKVETSAEDALLQSLLNAAQSQVENYIARRLMKQVIDLTLSKWPVGGIVLPFSPVLTVDSIKYYDASNVEQTWASANYMLNSKSEPCTIKYVDSTPSIYDDRLDRITVRFTVGYSSSTDLSLQRAAVPDELKTAILKKIADDYQHRNDAVRERFTAWQMFAYSYRVFHTPGEND